MKVFIKLHNHRLESLRQTHYALSCLLFDPFALFGSGSSSWGTILYLLKLVEMDSWFSKLLHGECFACSVYVFVVFFFTLVFLYAGLRFGSLSRKPHSVSRFHFTYLEVIPLWGNFHIIIFASSKYRQVENNMLYTK